jgi:predicted RNA-binding Zn-ribbon protein involved in translation (DUF1610 family)
MAVVILVAFLFVTPAFRFSCSRMFLHDFLGMDSGTMTTGMFFNEHSIIRMVPLLIMSALWAAIALWTYYDAEKRGMSGLLWGLLVFFGLFIGLIIYLIVRSTSGPETAVAPAQPAKCPSCAKPVQSAFVACPHCGTSLSHKCGHCGKQAEQDWRVCPYCGESMDGQ